MATTLLVITNNANAALSKICYPTYVSWNTVTQQWKSSIKPTKKFLLHVLTISMLQLHVLTLLGLAIYCEIFKSNLFSIGKLLLVSLAIGYVSSFSIQLNGILILFGQEMVLVANWASVHMKQLGIFPIPKSRANLLTELALEMQKAFTSKSNVDKFGIVAGYTFIANSLASFVFSFAIVFSDADFIFIVLFVISNFFGFTNYWFCSWYVNIIRYISTLWILQCLAVVPPTITALGVAILQVLIHSLTHLERVDLTYSNTKTFKTVFVANNIIFYMQKWLNGVFLGACFFVLILTINLSIFGKNFLPGHLYILAPFMAFTMLWGTMLILHYEKTTYNASCNIIKKWKSELALGTLAKPKYMKLLLYTLQPIAMPVGDIGIVDQDIQINYFSAVLDYVVNTSIIFKDLV